MREIKFRYIFQHLETGRILIKIFTLDELEVGCFTKWFDSLEDKWMNIGRDQYTGLKDKNNKEIYEGDIITHPLCVKEPHDEDEPCEHFVGVIRYEVERGQYFAINQKQNGYVLEMSLVYNFEVIGNIYENPELLKQ